MTDMLTSIKKQTGHKMSMETQNRCVYLCTWSKCTRVESGLGGIT